MAPTRTHAEATSAIEDAPLPPSAPPRARTTGAARAAAIAVGLTLLGGCTDGGGAEAAEPSCNEELVATGRGIPWDPGLALAVSYQIEAAHPELGNVIAAAAEYERTHPQYQELESPNYGQGPSVDGATGYLGTLLVLAERPDLATTETLDALEGAAHAGGMAAVGEAVLSGSRPDDPPEYRTDSFIEMKSLVLERDVALGDSDLVTLPHRPCQETDQEDGG